MLETDSETTGCSSSNWIFRYSISSYCSVILTPAPSKSDNESARELISNVPSSEDFSFTMNEFGIGWISCPDTAPKDGILFIFS